jgi:hypothetical protein
MVKAAVRFWFHRRRPIVVQAVAVVIVACSAPAPGVAADAVAGAATRPQVEVAVGMGASFDNAGLRAAGMSAIPAFFAMGGFGGGVLGLDLGLFVNSANGRFRAPNVPVDRLAVDAMLVIRPGVGLRPDDTRYGLRIVRTAALDVGLGYERAAHIAQKAEALNRFGTRVGAHLDVPLTAAGAPSELRLRVAVRRFIGGSTATFADGEPLPDSRAEVFAALAAVF